MGKEICLSQKTNQQVAGSIPVTSSTNSKNIYGGRFIMMSAEQLMSILQVRLNCEDGNPTSRSLLFELYQAMERLKEYESQNKVQEETAPLNL